MALRRRFKEKPFVGGMLFVVMMSPDIVMANLLLVLFMILGVSLGFWSLLFSAHYLLPAVCGGHGLFAAERF